MRFNTDPVKPQIRNRDVLMNVIQNTYTDSRFLVSERCVETDSFLDGLAVNRSAWYTKAELLAAVRESCLNLLPDMKGHEHLIVVSPALAVWKGRINESQVFPPTEDADDYECCRYQANEHYVVYFRFNHEKKVVEFALGSLKKQVPLEEHSGWAWKYLKSKLCCMDSFDLEKTFRDPFWSHDMVALGRKYLGIKPALR